MPSDDAAEGGTALVSSIVEPIALTKSSPDAEGAGRTAVGLRLLKPKRTRAGKEDSPGSPAPLSLVLPSWSASGPSLPIGHARFDGEFRRDSGLDLLMLSSSHFDPNRTRG